MFNFHHVALSVKEVDASVAFYRLLDFEKVAEWEADDKSLQIVHLKNGDAFVELFHYSNSQDAPDFTHTTDTDLPVIGTKHFAVGVASIDEARAKLEAAGVKIATEITHGRTGIDYFFITAPSGILVEVVQDNRGL